MGDEDGDVMIELNDEALFCYEDEMCVALSSSRLNCLRA
jgi:hypothetical protein